MTATNWTDEKLRAQSVHVLWGFRQLMQLGMHLYDLREEGTTEIADPLDAAALESFCVHARALIEFLWRDRKHHRHLVRSDDALAPDWFDSDTWRYERDLPSALHDVRRRTNFGVAHISYNRISPAEAWDWDHVAIADQIASRFSWFVDDVPEFRVDADFKGMATRENLASRAYVEPQGLVLRPPHTVGTPAHASLWIVNR